MSRNFFSIDSVLVVSFSILHLSIIRVLTYFNANRFKYANIGVFKIKYANIGVFNRIGVNNNKIEERTHSG